MNGQRRRHKPMRVLILAGLLGLLNMAPHAQSGERFHGRLSVLPVDVATVRTMSGSGEAHATLSGNSLVITGTFEFFDRQTLKQTLEGQGANVTGSVTRKTDLVVVGESPGSKLDKAQALGIETWDESALRTTLKGDAS